jgi:hypothetical protein
MKRVLLMVGLVALAACTTQQETVAGIPTSTFLPIPSQQPRFTATPESTRTPLPTFTFTPTDTPIPPTQTNTPVPTPTPTVAGIVQSLQRVNVRTGPGENFESFDSLAPGTGVQIIGQTADGAWFNVRLEDGREGWMAARLLFIAATATPFATPTPSPDMTALFSANPLPTSILGGGTVTPTPPGIAVTATTIGARPTEVIQASPTATQPLVPIVSSVPMVDLGVVQLTATALARGAATPTASFTPPAPATEARILTVVPQGTGSSATLVTSPTIMPTAGVATAAAGGVDNPANPNVFAFCGNVPKFGIGAPTNLRVGQTIDIWWDWYAKEASQVQDHIDHSQHDVRVNGQPVANVNSYVTPIRRSGSDYAASWYIPYGPLAAGTYEITYVVTWDEPIVDGYTSFGPGTNKPFEQETCTFTVR